MGLLKALIRRKEIIAISTLAVAGIALLASLAQDPLYVARASVQVDPGEGTLPSERVIQLAHADEVARGTSADIEGLGSGFVAAQTSVSAGPDNVFTVEAEAGSPDDAARLATTFAEQFVDYANNLGEFPGEAQLVEEAEIPSNPQTPETVRNTALGAVAGLLIGLVLALVRDRLDRRVRSAREVVGLCEVPLLARIPDSPALSLDRGLRHLPAADAESFQMARVGIRYLDVDREIKSVLLTSPQAGDGKTMVTFGLAAAAATAGDGVLVIEADMRQPGLDEVAEPTRVGLSTVLAGDSRFEDAARSVPVTVGAERDSGAVDLLLAGPAPTNPTRLLESERMERLLREVEQRYDLVVIDTPPATILPDAIPLMGHVDGVVMVAGLGRDTQDELSELRQRLEQVDAPVIGVIANFAEAPDESYYRYLHAHEAAVAEAGAVPLQPATQAQTQPASAPRRRRRPFRRRRPAAEAPTPIDLNSVTYDELRRLDLSNTQAKRVLAYRDRLGGFSSIDEIDEVPGFPDKLRNALKQRVTV
jgi:capsular exopolysaccharide synthesis family protein